MRLHLKVGLWVLAIAGAVRGAHADGHTWIVVSDRALDSRIERQLNVMAAHDQALIRIVNGSAEKTRTAPGGGGLLIELRWQGSAEAFLAALNREASSTSVAPTADLAAEGYIIEANYPRASAPDRLRLTAMTWNGFHNGLLRVPDLLDLTPSNLSTALVPHAQAVRIEKNGLAAVIADYPSFPKRGVVEGFYGTPWTHQDRVEILRFEGAHAMNVYYYAPKDDPYHRKLWREAYPLEAQQHLSELVDAAHRNFVDFCFAISPGLTMTYSSDQDFSVLTNKLASVGKLGVSCFALFLDDVPQELQDPQDVSRFKTLAQAHVSLTNRLNRYLKQQSASNRLTLTPTTYTNEWGNPEYVKELGAGVDPGVSIVWTGPKTISPAITAEQANEWGGYLHRAPLVWDNFPVNDGTPWCRYLGPLVGRDPHLPGAVEGLVSNPMIEPHASMIPLQTIADYLWNAPAYDPARSETHAVVSQYGEDAPRQLAPFLKIYGTYYWDEGNFSALFRERRRPLDIANMQTQLTEMNSALARLRYQRKLEPLLKEIAPAITRATERLAEVKADPAFRNRSDGTLQWNEDYESLSANRLTQSPNLNGDFSKWENGPVYRLNEHGQVVTGARRWNGPAESSAKLALGWDGSFLYVGVDVVDPDLYQPFFGRGIQNGDTVTLKIETGYRKNFFATEPTGDEYALYFSPGNFADIAPSIFSDEDYLPRRPQPHDYMKEIYTAWKKTAHGYSGDIAIPATFFEGGTLKPGYEIGLGFGVTKVLRPSRPVATDDLERIVMQSKKDHLFRLSTGNPSSYPRLVLSDGTP